MRAVVDTNVLVSALLRDRDPERVLLFLAEKDDWDWLVTSEIVSEYEEVIARPKLAIPADLRRYWTNVIERASTLIVADVEVKLPRDPKDVHVLACALIANADYLITGDRDLLEAAKLPNTRIVTVSQFRKTVIEA